MLFINSYLEEQTNPIDTRVYSIFPVIDTVWDVRRSSECEDSSSCNTSQVYYQVYGLGGMVWV
jgi:hypothetical protein